MSELISANNLRGLAAELIATFTFVFVGIGAVGAALSMTTPIDGTGLVIISLGHGLGIFLGIVVIGRVTGAHLNPAVTIAMVISGNIGIIRAVSYIVGQLAGAALAALLLDQFVWGLGNLGVHGLGATETGDGLVIEVILTFFLVFTIFATAVDKRGNAAWAPLAIGMVIFVDHLIAVPLTGASMNPARSFGPALIHGVWTDHWLYWAAPILGGVVAAIVYVVILGTKEDQDRLGMINMGTD
ncbi:MAG: MIP family channel protein [Dehalococcoidia bacterium]|jgi:MIP family channel proteins|nr:MIP family channel protein [Dehalococcoidia bacterium]